MDIHTTEAIAVLRRKGRMTIPQIGEQAALAYEALCAEAMARQLVINGPPLFVAQSMPQDAHTVFELEFCLPVVSDELPALPALRCARLMYEGPLSKLFTGGYQPLLQAMAVAGLRASSESREVYHGWHGPESADNRIEIQIGVAHT
ncbi:GyrI-like domain-containing protein [Azospirillum thermophilum]|uniref:AraC family transcriptional regulator n=1 Tax=Azospirillum thermophilum TaxID=2202148 RepID=A0A2S2CNB7_9PROT|nr:GyrI-like domain-containing protein [Azospirillum thermophilum]AWK85966.1 AraC family transcriptional regulator [Azospirillum thermophilum]